MLFVFFCLHTFVYHFIVFLISQFLNFDYYQAAAVILQAGTHTAISTILMAEAYDVKQKIASKILFTTTLISIVTIPFLKIFMNAFMFQRFGIATAMGWIIGFILMGFTVYQMKRLSNMAFKTAESLEV